MEEFYLKHELENKNEIQCWYWNEGKQNVKDGKGMPEPRVLISLLYAQHGLMIECTVSGHML